MQRNFLSALKKILADRHRRRVWQRIVSGMMAVVVFCTTYALILPGITLERQAYCGLEEHTHTDECYTSDTGQIEKLICSPESDAEFVIHTHDDKCYVNGNFVCQLDELEEHEHSDDCYSETTELVCELEESEGHTHTDECYELTLGDLTCDDTSETHEHDDSCYEQVEELVCGQEETEGHTHDENCYNKVQENVCDLPRVVEHKHSESCYKNGVVSCGLPEITKHQHTDECFEKVTLVGSEVTETVCGKEEHKHNEDCYKTNEETSENSGGGGGGATLNSETTTATEGATQSTTASALTEAATETTTTAHEDLVFPYSDDKVSGIITLPWSEELPDNLECAAVRITDDDDNYHNMVSSVSNSIENGTREVEDVLLYKLEWSAGEDTYVLPEGLTPKIQFTILDVNEDTYIEGILLTDYDESQDVDPENVSINKFSIETIDTDFLNPYSLDIGSDKESEIPETEVPDIDDEILTPYNVDIVSADNTDSSVEFDLDGAEIFAFALDSETDYGTGGYYKSVTDASELDSSKTYLIVAQNGMLAMKITDPEVAKRRFYICDDAGNKVAYTDVSVHVYGSRPVEIQRVPTSLDYDTNNSAEYFRIVDPADGDSPVTPSSSEFKGMHCKFDTTYAAYGVYRVDALGATGIGTSSGTLTYFSVPYNSSNGNYYTYISKSYSGNAAWTIEGAAYNYVYNNTGEINTDYGVQYLYAYLYSDGDEIFQHPSGNFGRYTETRFLIFEYVPNDVETKSDITAVKGLEESALEEEEEERAEKKSKPDCAKFVEITGAKTIETTFDEKHTLDGAKLTAKSDPASSLIEDELCVDDSKSDLDALYEKQKDNDGRLLTDKSVIYGADDYKAIDVSDYESGDFSVALSALGQEWGTENGEDKTPIDVVLIFDVSNSMTFSVSDKDSTPKWQASVDAINDVSKEIFDANEKNRVGIAAFSNSSVEILPIGRYSSDDGNIFTYTAGDYKTLKISDTLYDGTDPDTRTASSYRSEAMYDLSPYTGADSRGLWSATFTQRGIQKGYELFKDVTDTTVYYPSIDKEYIRQPVTVLLTDGDPTFCTYNYMDPKSGPYYGTGLSNGIEGYYTVLSANYFKNMISLHYKRNSVFYTIGMGIKPSGYGTYYEEGEFSLDRFVIEPDNSYMRAVLNPTEENINALSDYSRYWEKNYREDMEYADKFKEGAEYSANVYKTTGPIFKQLITGKDENGNAIDAGSISGSTCYEYYSDSVGYDACYGPGLGYSENKIYGVDNPYKDDYDYVDEAYFGQLGRDDLDSIFERILENIQLKPKYAYILKEGTNVVITDPIGSGMTVKGEPVLRYFGTNYTVTDKENGEDDNSTYTDYYWKKTVTRVEQSDAKADDMDVDLSKVVARVSVDKTTGDQTVTLTIPETALPVFYPDLNRNFYYEELPVRLIYRVGLSEAEEQKLADEYKDELYVSGTYYTNKYSDGAAATVVKFTPEESDPYYKDMTDTITYQKETNTTDTVAYNFSESYNADTGEVTQLLGNNGVLQVEKGEVVDIKVKKEWEANNTTHPDKVNVVLYVKGSKTDKDGNKTSFARICDLVQLSDDNNWEYTWKKLRRVEVDDDGSTYNYDVYYVGELAIDDYMPVYRNENDTTLETSYMKFDVTSEMSKYMNDPDYKFSYSFDRITSDDDVSAYSTDASDFLADKNEQAYSEEELKEELGEDINIEPMVAGFYKMVILANVVDATNGEVTIKNVQTYNLPAAGGCGYVLEIAAIIMILCALVMVILKKFGLNRNKG